MRAGAPPCAAPPRRAFGHRRERRYATASRRALRSKGRRPYVSSTQFSGLLARLLDDARKRGERFVAGVFEVSLRQCLRYRRGCVARTITHCPTAGKADDLTDEARYRKTAGRRGKRHFQPETVFQPEMQLGCHQRIHADFREWPV